jgi:hypothetical protein
MDWCAALPRPLEEFGGSHWRSNYDAPNTRRIWGNEVEVLLVTSDGYLFIYTIRISTGHVLGGEVVNWVSMLRITLRYMYTYASDPLV